VKSKPIRVKKAGSTITPIPKTVLHLELRDRQTHHRCHVPSLVFDEQAIQDQNWFDDDEPETGLELFENSGDEYLENEERLYTAPQVQIFEIIYSRRIL
jgi:hypothetical protein